MQLFKVWLMREAGTYEVNADHYFVSAEGMVNFYKGEKEKMEIVMTVAPGVWESIGTVERGGEG